MICFRRRVTETFRFLQRDELHRSGRGYRPPAGRTSFPLFSQSKSGFVIEYAITTLIKADVLFIVQSPAVLDSSPASILAASSESGTKKKKKRRMRNKKLRLLTASVSCLSKTPLLLRSRENVRGLFVLIRGKNQELIPKLANPERHQGIGTPHLKPRTRLKLTTKESNKRPEALKSCQ